MKISQYERDLINLVRMLRHSDRLALLTLAECLAKPRAANPYAGIPANEHGNVRAVIYIDAQRGVKRTPAQAWSLIQKARSKVVA